MEEDEKPSTSGAGNSPNADQKKLSVPTLNFEHVDDSDSNMSGHGLAIMEEDDDVVDKELEAKSQKVKLTAKNVKSLLHQVITNEQVLDMVRNTLQQEGMEEQLKEAIFEPKMTRAKVKEVMEKGEVIPNWNLPSFKPSDPMKKPQFLEISFSDTEENEDEEYKPAPDELAASDDEDNLSSVFSDLGSPAASMPSTPCTPASVSAMAASSTPTRPDPEEEDEATIAKRTRSKLPLKDTPLEVIESTFVAPDITPDMYDTHCNDADWQDFLKGLVVTTGNDDNEEDNDPEYNFLGDAEDGEEEDDEDYRNDKAVRIPKKEVDELLEELFEEYEDDDEDSQGPTSPSDSSGESKKKKLKVSDSSDLASTQESQDNGQTGDAGMTSTGDESPKEDSDKGGSPVVSQQCPVFMPPLRIDGPLANVLVTDMLKSGGESAQLSSASILHKDSSEIKITNDEHLQIRDQMRKHIQLLAQTFVQSSVETDSQLIQNVNKMSKMFLIELQALGEKSVCIGRKSAFLETNLQGAIEICDRDLTTFHREKNELLRRCATSVANADQHFYDTTHLLTYEHMETILSSRVFLYPQMIPEKVFHVVHAPERTRVCFTEAEDNLLAMGLEQFSQTLNKYFLINELLLPTKKKVQLRNRVKNLKAHKSATNAVQLFEQTGKLPSFPKYAEVEDEHCIVAPRLRDPDLLPYWWTAFDKCGTEWDQLILNRLKDSIDQEQIKRTLQAEEAKIAAGGSQTPQTMQIVQYGAPGNVTTMACQPMDTGNAGPVTYLQQQLPLTQTINPGIPQIVQIVTTTPTGQVQGQIQQIQGQVIQSQIQGQVQQLQGQVIQGQIHGQVPQIQGQVLQGQVIQGQVPQIQGQVLQDQIQGQMPQNQGQIQGQTNVMQSAFPSVTNQICPTQNQNFTSVANVSNINQNPTFNQSGMCVTMGTSQPPVQHTTYGPTTVQQPMVHTKVQQPTVQTTVQQPIGQTTVQQPIGQTTVQQPIGQTTVQQPIGQTTVQQPIGQTTVQQPIGQTTVQQPIGQTTVQQPIVTQDLSAGGATVQGIPEPMEQTPAFDPSLPATVQIINTPQEQVYKTETPSTVRDPAVPDNAFVPISQPGDDSTSSTILLENRPGSGLSLDNPGTPESVTMATRVTSLGNPSVAKVKGTSRPSSPISLPRTPPIGASGLGRFQVRAAGSPVNLPSSRSSSPLTLRTDTPPPGDSTDTGTQQPESRASPVSVSMATTRPDNLSLSKVAMNNAALKNATPQKPAESEEAITSSNSDVTSSSSLFTSPPRSTQEESMDYQDSSMLSPFDSPTKVFRAIIQSEMKAAGDGGEGPVPVITSPPRSRRGGGDTTRTTTVHQGTLTSPRAHSQPEHASPRKSCGKVSESLYNSDSNSCSEFPPPGPKSDAASPFESSFTPLTNTTPDKEDQEEGGPSISQVLDDLNSLNSGKFVPRGFHGRSPRRNKSPRKRLIMSPRKLLPKPYSSPVKPVSPGLKDSPSRRALNERVRTILPKGMVVRTAVSPAKASAAALSAKARQIATRRNNPRAVRRLNPILPRPDPQTNGDPGTGTVLVSRDMLERALQNSAALNAEGTDPSDGPDGDEDSMAEDDFFEGDSQDDQSDESEADGMDQDDNDDIIDDDDDVIDDDEDDDEDDDIEDIDDLDDREEVTQDDNHLEALMAASTTIQFKVDSALPASTEQKPTKGLQKQQDLINSLAPDIIETDPMRDEKDTAFAKSYLQKARMLLSGDNEMYAKFLKVLQDFSLSENNPVELYRHVAELFADYPELVEDFSAFLLPEQARECGCFMANNLMDRARRFLRKVEIHLKKKPTQLVKFTKALAAWREDGTDDLAGLLEQVQPALGPFPHLLDELASFFSEEAPPKRQMTDFEDVDISNDDELEVYKPDQFEEVNLGYI